jgi:(S)-mandelate dehydrogenase
MPRFINVEDFREQARRRLPRTVFDYLEGGAGNDRGLETNRAAFDRFELVPKRFRNVSVRSSAIELFGATLAAPFFIAPTGLNGLLWPDGDIALARAAAAAGVPFVLSTPSQCSIEEVAAKASGALWFQLYVVDRALADALVARAWTAGYRTLMLTVDVPASPKRERDLHNGFSFPMRATPRTIAESLAHPRWTYRVARHGGQVLANFLSDATSAAPALLRREMDASLTWTYLSHLRASWPGRLIVKGVMDPLDAIKCFERGADAVLLSNHGGRQLDSAPAPIAMLPHVAALVEGTLLVDSGFRRGSDIVKAIALGASAVAIGRAVLYGLAVGGESGVRDVIAILEDEIDNTLAQIGCASATALSSEFIAYRAPTTTAMLPVAP